MSVTSLLIFDADKLPSLAEVCSEATRSGDPIEFPEAVDTQSHTGFLPVRVFGRDTGFEYYFDAIPEGALPPEVTQFGSHHIVVQTGSSFEEGRAALMYLKIAAQLTGGAYVYPDDAIVVGPESAQSYLNEQIEEYGKYIK